MRIALLSPRLPPDHCGVGDYAARLALELAAQGHDVHAFTFQPRPQPIERVAVHPTTLKVLPAQLRELRIEALSIQYTPYLYGRGGIHPGFVAWLAALPALAPDTRIALTAHELHYPVALTREGLTFGVAQAAQWLALSLAAPRIFFTYERAWEQATRRLAWKRDRLSWLPVGATIDETSERGPARPANSVVPAHHRLLLHFGSAHPTRIFGHLFSALDRVRDELGADRVTLAFVGLEDGALDAKLRGAGRMDLRPLIRGLGYLPPSGVRAWLKRADAVLAPFLDGISTRRSSAIAALAHERPLVTTRAWSTDPGMPWSDACQVVAADDAAAFGEAVCAVLRNPVFSADLARRGRLLYEKRLSWDVIARELVERIRS